MKIILGVSMFLVIALLCGPGSVHAQSCETACKNMLPAVAVSLDENPSETTRKAIEGARHSVDALVYKFDDSSIMKALRKAIERGVTVRLLMDGEEADRKRSLADDIEKEGAKVRIWKPKDGKLHAKCMIIDGKQVLTGSPNWTDSAAEKNVELILTFTDPVPTKDFVVLFERLWEEGKKIKN